MKSFKLDKISRDLDYHNMLAKQIGVTVKESLSEAQIIQYFKKKLHEETLEVLHEHTPEALISELVDCLEVIYGFAKTLRVGSKHLDALREQKRAHRGGFDTPVVIESIQISPQHPDYDRFATRPEKYPEIT